MFHEVGQDIGELRTISVVLPTDHRRVDSSPRCSFEGPGGVIVTDHQLDVGLDPWVVDQRLEVGPGAGGEYCYVDFGPPDATRAGV